MFLPPRFVVIDDNSKHLNAILDVFQQFGAPCLGVVFDPQHGLEKKHFECIRALFLDLHLVHGAVTTDEAQHFATIAGILESNISPTGGPFILVVWTEHEHLVEGLVKYLDESLDRAKPHARPLAITNLAKEQFINTETGKTLGDKTKALRDAVASAVRQKAQLAALVAWETDVQRAAGATLSAVMELVPEEQRNSDSFADGLDEVLGRLARETVGQPQVEVDPRAAIAAALAPILSDRVLNQEVSDADTEVWKEAVTWQGKEALDSKRAGTVNRMLHVAVPSSETIRPTDWGAVVELPDGWRSKGEFLSHFGVTPNKLFGDELKIAKADRGRCRLRLVRVGAACDHAQNRPGPLPYLLGVEIDCTVERIPDDTGAVRLPASVWSSPVLWLDPDIGPFVLAVNSRYSLGVTSADAKDWQPVYRLRDQLTMHLISHAGSYLTRPGIVQF